MWKMQHLAVAAVVAAIGLGTGGHPSRSDQLKIIRFEINPVPQYDEAGKRVGALALASKDGEFPVVAQKKGLVAFAYDGRIVWVDEFDVKLSRSKDSGITCVHRGGGLSAGPNLKPLTDIGAGEDC
jgi:hypothetical protein